MIAVKFIHKKPKDFKTSKEYPLYVRVTKSRQTVYLSTGIKLKPNQWNDSKQIIKSSYPNSARANHRKESIKTELNQVAFDLEMNSKSYSAKQIKELYLNDNKDSLIEYMKSWISKRSDQGKITVGTESKYNAVLNKIDEYTKGDLLVRQLTTKWLEDFETYLKDEKENSTNTIATNMSTLRAVTNDLIRDRLINANDNPFLRYEFKHADTVVEFLYPEELLKIEALDYPKTCVKEETRLIFLFCCYTGLRIGDALNLQPSNFDGTHINYYTQKTKEHLRLKLTSKAKEIMCDRIDRNSGSTPFVFKFLREERLQDAKEAHLEQKRKTSLINKYLKTIANDAKIDKKLRSHIARHSAAGIGLLKGLSLVEVQSILGHKSIDTTQRYTQIRDRLKDAAIDKLDQ